MTINQQPTIPVRSLSDSDQHKLEECESVIRQNLQSFFDVAEALAIIKEDRLYRLGYRSFVDYCNRRWGMSDRYARYLIRAKAVIDALTDEGVIVLPQTEAQARPLSAFEPEVAANVWERALDEATRVGEEPTLKSVQASADDYLVRNGNWPYLAHLLDVTTLSPTEARKAMVALDSSDLICANYMAASFITDPVVILEMNRLYKSGSDVFTDIVTTGFLQFDDNTGIKFENATPRDLRRMVDEQRTHHLRENAIASGSILVMLYTGNARRNVEQLRKYLGQDEIEQIVQEVIKAKDSP